MKKVRTGACVLAALALSACASTDDDAFDDRRAFVQLMKRTTLTELEKAKPETRDLVARSAGWAVFGDGGAGALGAKPGVGFGVAHDAKTGAETYLRMKRPDAESGAPPFRLVLVFADAARFHDFAKGGGSFDGPSPPGVDVWQLFAEGPAFEPEIAGVSFYVDPDLKSAH